MGKLAIVLTGVWMATFAFLGASHTSGEFSPSSLFALGEVPDAVVTSASSVLWFLTLALVGWKASEQRPAYARTKSR